MSWPRSLLLLGVVGALVFAVPAGGQAVPDEHSKNMTLLATKMPFIGRG